MKQYKLTTFFLLLSYVGFAQVDTSTTTANIKEATIYFGYGAELTHKAAAKVNSNTKYIIIDNLSTQIDEQSLQISCPEWISLLSQRFSVFYPTNITPAAKPNILVNKMKDSITILNKRIESLQNKIHIEETTLAKTDKLIEATIATSTQKTALTDEVLKLIAYNTQKIEKNKTAIFNFQIEVNDLQEKVAGLNEHIQTEINKTTIPIVNNIKPYGRIVLQVICNQSKEADIALSYYTNNAGWQPIYDLRVNSKTNNIKLVYKASVIQNTGLDWKKTKITLSTGTPNFTTTAPTLNAWYLKYYVPQLYGQLNQVVTNGYGVNRMQSFADKDIVEKEELLSKKQLAYSTQTVLASTLNEFTSLKENLLNTSFEIDLPYDIESNGLSHSINIKEEEIKSVLKNYAVPKLDNDAYLIAELANWQNLDLIPGNANIIMDDTYIGKSFIDPNATTDTLNLSLGRDKRIAIKRTLVKDETTSKTKDANVKKVFTYEITVKNNKAKEVNIVLKDQYPLSNIKEIESNLIDAEDALINAELGIVTWKITLKPGESKKVRFSYSVKYPANQKLASMR
jgi:uncharacterized protein (TIGR02231 family)